MVVFCDVSVDVVSDEATLLEFDTTEEVADDEVDVTDEVEEFLLEVSVYLTSSNSFPLWVVQVGI